MGGIYIVFVSRLRPVGFNVLVYQSHVLQHYRVACGHEASCYLTLSATEARIKYLILLRLERSTPH